MSASLVGSEMCIRDSARRVNLCSPTWKALLVPLRSRWRRSTGTREPVSYTHLTLPTICSV
eukprot:6766452-Alexandrium_andersonii.AAC.1